MTIDNDARTGSNNTYRTRTSCTPYCAPPMALSLGYVGLEALIDTCHIPILQRYAFSAGWADHE